jgi:serpin B
LRYSAQGEQFSLANSAWITSDYHLSADFEQAVTGSFGGEAKSLGGANPVAQINTWIAEKTGGKITRMLDHLSDEQRLMLISCVYFKGLWGNPFEEHKTRQRAFHAPSSDQCRPFMHLRGSFEYFEDRNIQAISLRYGSIGGMVCLVILPSRKFGLRQFLRRLEPSFWYSVRNELDYRPGKLALPRFRVEGSEQLNASLREAGIHRAFEPDKSDFGGMLREPDPLWIDAAQQNTYLEVNEKGTEAAAASFLDVPPTAALLPTLPRVPFEMVVDRPFFCAIGNVASGLILFTASVWDV